ncbi:hypothetical protein MUN89_07345 [Halobacillus salinarum]|uniref:Uncharacterized protein n=1 Tax=Halobacillus salinarum TaxID=2932257 RepID=A0ABY4EQ16_9BACI|nr:hypothetical protein [Halobacillus salinarum]UOQ45737.1 hypothetical protein MUN89_07345 [Halobacillus salinarum]
MYKPAKRLESGCRECLDSQILVSIKARQNEIEIVTMEELVPENQRSEKEGDRSEE